MKTVQKPLGALRPYAKNPRKNAAAVDAVAESISRYGFLVPLVISAEGEIVAGDTRYKAALKLGLEAVPCVVADELTEEQIKAFRLVDNKVAEIAEWDEALLAAELSDVAADLSIFGFEPFEGNPAEEPKKEKPDNAFTYQEQYGVIVLCADEARQKEAYETLSGMGYDCKVVAT
jgi:site-specific DNA-methyltransferase (adenine-specific)